MFNSDNFSNVSETRKAEFTLVEKPHLKVISFNKEKHGYLIIRQSFVNRICGHLTNGGSLKIRSTVPLIKLKIRFTVPLRKP